MTTPTILPREAGDGSDVQIIILEAAEHRSAIMRALQRAIVGQFAKIVGFGATAPEKLAVLHEITRPENFVDPEGAWRRLRDLAEKHQEVLPLSYPGLTRYPRTSDIADLSVASDHFHDAARHLRYIEKTVYPLLMQDAHYDLTRHSVPGVQKRSDFVAEGANASEADIAALEDGRAAAIEASGASAEVGR